MDRVTASRRESIRHNQNQLLYSGLLYSYFGSALASVALVFTFAPLVPGHSAWIWYALVNLAYGLRLLDYHLYLRSSSRESRVWYWGRRFSAGAMLAALSWIASLWLLFPPDDTVHQLLLIMTLVGVAGGSLAALPYDRRLNFTFQLLIFLAVEARMLFSDHAYYAEMALYCVLAFGFLIGCGEKVGRHYLELLRLKQDSQETNLTLIKTTEQMARTGYWQWDESANWIELSENLATMWGFEQRRVLIRDCFRLMPRDDRRRIRRSLQTVLQRHQEVAVEHRVVDRTNGGVREMRQVIKPISEALDETRWLGTVQDISDIRSAEQTIYHMAYYDELTGLANRANFHERLQAAVDECHCRQQEFSVVYIDLDDFKGVNDSYGHECGDRYLKAFADHLQDVVRRVDLVARLGGDEFCVLLADTQGDTDARRVAERILEFSDRTLQIDNHRIHPKLSVGIALFPQDGDSPDGIVKSADLAMYSVKRSGKHGHAFYSSRMREESLDTARLEADFRSALDREEFEVWYQPQINLADNRISGVEALIRWRHPERGLVRPDIFIGVAERVGMINEIGEWVLATTCRQLADWKRQGYRLQAAVNISGGHFTSAGFCESACRAVRENDLEHGELEIEITESLSRDPQEHYRICHALRAVGIRVSIDDFGTGYSSLSVLQKLEVDAVKIDQSFIRGLPDQESSRLLVSAIIRMSQGLGHDLVAEGVETEDQLTFLRSLGCSHVQGYLFSKPVRSEVIPTLIDEFNERARVA